MIIPSFGGILGFFRSLKAFMSLKAIEGAQVVIYQKRLLFEGNIEI